MGSLLKLKYSNLRHPNVVLMIGVCVPPDPCVIVTELFEKNSLQHILNSIETVSLQQKIGFALDIAKGMCYLHNGNLYEDHTSNHPSSHTAPRFEAS